MSKVVATRLQLLPRELERVLAEMRDRSSTVVTVCSFSEQTKGKTAECGGEYTSAGGRPNRSFRRVAAASLYGRCGDPDRALAGRVRVEAEVARIRNGSSEAGRRGDHRRVVGAERERRERGAGERLAELRVRGDAADDGDPLRARSARPPRARGRRARARSRAGTRRRGRRGAAPARRARGRAPRRGAPSSARRRRSRGRGRARPGSRTPPGRPGARAGRSRVRRDSRARAAARPCRTPRRRRRRGSCRAARARRGRARRAASCGRRSRAGRRTAARRGSGCR